jgi:U-box domain-containing protein 5
MSINFCNDGLATIKSDKVSNDGHDVTNLISVDLSQRKKGFLADNFIKPPVCIDVNFVCTVNITKIVLGCSVGAQKSSDFEVMTTGSPVSSIAVGHATPEKNAVVFYIQGQDSKLSTEELDQSVCTTFKSARKLFNIKGLCVRIFKTQNSSVPALSRLEVWATPSKCVPRNFKNHIEKVWKSICKPVVNSTPVEEKQEEASSSNVEPVKEGLDIPEDFIDPITNEFMTIPMTLPSGKVVDVTTMEKFNKAEEEWGRTPCDPFTGTPFSDNNKPVVATSLKARMDKFLIENSDLPEVKNLPRTTGKRPGSQCDSESKKMKSESLEAPPHHQNSDTSQVTSTNCEDSKSNVENVLKATLDGLPSFLEKQPENKVSNECAKCSAREQLFKLPCEHLVCRPCLVSMKDNTENKCTTCSTVFSYNEPVRFHCSSIDA